MEKPSTPNIEIFYEKNPLYRTIYADGLIGGKTPSNAFNFSFYATRNPIPKSCLHAIDVDGSVNAKGIHSLESKVGIMREIEIGVYMNTETARDIYEFLKIFFEDGK